MAKGTQKRLSIAKLMVLTFYFAVLFAIPIEFCVFIFLAAMFAVFVSSPIMFTSAFFSDARNGQLDVDKNIVVVVAEKVTFAMGLVGIFSMVAFLVRRFLESMLAQFRYRLNFSLTNETPAI